MLCSHAFIFEINVHTIQGTDQLMLGVEGGGGKYKRYILSFSSKKGFDPILLPYQF